MNKLNEAVEALASAQSPYEVLHDGDAERTARAQAIRASLEPHGKVLHRYVQRRFKDALAVHGLVATTSYNAKGYEEFWENRKVVVRAYVSVCIRSRGADQRGEHRLIHLPTSGGDLKKWCDKWIAWFKAMPGEES